MKHAISISLLGFLALAACSPKSEPPAETQAKASLEAELVKNPEIAAVAGVGSDANLLNCTTPVKRGDTYKSLAAAYRDKAQLGMIPGAEGTESRGLLLYATIPSRKLYVRFWDAAMEHVAQVEPGEKAVAWTGPEGIHVGSTLAYVEKVNGKPFTISGFGWDYGGYAADFKGGRLASLSGGCVLQLRFDGATLPEGVSGDGVMVDSDDSRLKDARVVVTEMSVGWALPAGVTPAE